MVSPWQRSRSSVQHNPAARRCYPQTAQRSSVVGPIFRNVRYSLLVRDVSRRKEDAEGCPSRSFRRIRECSDQTREFGHRVRERSDSVRERSHQSRELSDRAHERSDSVRELSHQTRELSNRARELSDRARELSDRARERSDCAHERSDSVRERSHQTRELSHSTRERSHPVGQRSDRATGFSTTADCPRPHVQGGSSRVTPSCRRM